MVHVARVALSSVLLLAGSSEAEARERCVVKSRCDLCTVCGGGGGARGAGRGGEGGRAHTESASLVSECPSLVR